MTPAIIANSVMFHLITETTLSLGFTNLVMFTPADFDTYDLTRGSWSLGVPTEVYLDSLSTSEYDDTNNIHTPMTDNDSSITQKHTSLWSSTDWSFLYGREPLPRHSMGVLVVGPPHWVCMAAKQLLSRKVFGSMDTLMLAPVDGNILARDLCPSIPLAVHVILLEEPHDKEGTRRCKGLLREATLADGGSYVLRTVGCLQQGRLLLTTSLLRPVTSLKGGLIKVFYAKVWDEMLEGTLETFMRKLNFTVEVSGNVGAMDKMPNGTFKGAMGLIQRKELDVLVSSMSMLPERAEVVDYSEWFFISYVKFFTKVPKLLEDTFQLYQLFSLKTWCAIGGFLILASTMLTLSWNAIPGSKKTAVSVQITVTTALKTVIYMGCKQLPENTAGRLLLTSTWLVAIVLVATYTGNLTAFLSIPRIEKVPQTIKEMIDMDYDLSISYGFSQYEKLKTSPSKDQQYLFHRAVFRHDIFNEPEDKFVQMVLTQRISLIVSGQTSLILQDLYAKADGPVKICTLKQGSEVLYMDIVGIVFPKNSPLKPLFDKEIIWMRNSLLISLPSSKCVFVNLRNEELKPLSMVKVGGVLIVWAVGVVLASFLFLAEILYFNIHLNYGKV